MRLLKELAVIESHICSACIDEDACYTYAMHLECGIYQAVREIKRELLYIDDRARRAYRGNLDPDEVLIRIVKSVGAGRWRKGGYRR